VVVLALIIFDSSLNPGDHMTPIARTFKPRNPFAVAASRRRAGSHRPGVGALRRRMQRELRRELQQERHPDT
jgi:hypothetical protein